jgi:ribosomal protein S6-L-glutamate ligase RimK-like protein
MSFEVDFGSLPRTERFALGLTTYRARRRLAGWLKRSVRWEFWPPYIFYPPVIAYVIYLGIRFRSLTLFTAANPAIPASGFVGESKREILEHLKNAASFLPASALLEEGEPEARFEQVQAFMQRHELSFPIVLKPDAGQRGSGVLVARSSQQVRQYLDQAPFPALVQEYVGGREFGVFHIRRRWVASCSHG